MQADPNGDWYAKDEADARIAELEKRINQATIALAEQLGARHKAEAERDAARADAERYRWLRNEARLVEFYAPLVFMADDWGNSTAALYDEQLDAAIDAARSKE
jgi:multidrug resistance efflux pump